MGYPAADTDGSCLEGVNLYGSERRGSLPRSMAKRIDLLPNLCFFWSWLVLLGLFIWTPPLEARTYLTVEEALALAFPGCSVERSTVYLSAAEVKKAEKLSGGEVDSALVYPYRAQCPKGAGGVVYFDSHRVRTLPETIMVVLGERSEVRQVEILVFKEPPDYIPVELWYEQFVGEELDEDLFLKKDIQPVTGATLTARATTQAVRRVLALHRVVEAKGSPTTKEPSELSDSLESKQ